jgi:hypothetical protein
MLLDQRSDRVNWCREAAKLDAFADAYAAYYGVSPELDGGRFRLALACVSDESLQTNRELARRLIHLEEKSGGSDVVFPERMADLQAIAADIENELQRRKNGGQVMSPSEAIIRASSPPSERYNARLLEKITLAFPKAESRPEPLIVEATEIVMGQAKKYRQAISGNLARWNEFQRSYALATHQITSQQMDEMTKARELIFVLPQEFNAHLEKVASFVATTEMTSDKTVFILAGLFPRGPPPPPDAGAVLGRSSPPPSKGPPGGAAASLQHIASMPAASRKIEQRLFLLGSLLDRLEAYMRANEALAAKLPSREPVLTNSQKGRLIASEDALRKTNTYDGHTTYEAEKDRLPMEYKGRFDEKGKPFDYDDAVRNPKTFKALGGGIHLGTRANPEKGVDLSTAILIYEKEKGLFLRDGKTGHEWVVDAESDPTSIRALLRFAAAGRNAAISIGWGSERKSALEVGANMKRDGSTVYLDPYLVDTQVGRQLIAADSIPWDLDTFALEDGSKFSFAESFKEEKEAYRDVVKKSLLEVVSTVKPSNALEGLAFANYLEKSDGRMGLALPLLFKAPDEEAKKWHQQRAYQRYYEEAKKTYQTEADLIYNNLLTPKIKGMITLDDGADGDVEDRYSFERRLAQRIEKKTLSDLKRKLTSNQTIDQEKVRDYAEKNAREITAKIAAEISQSFEEVKPLYDNKLRSTLVMSIMAESFVAEFSKTGNRAMVEAWIAKELGDGVKPERIADNLTSLMNATTLAVLYDDSSSFHLNDGKVEIDTVLKYRYATTHVEISDKNIRLGKDADGSEVRTLVGLTRMTNEGMEEIFRSFKPLREIRRYAATAAFLRWADHAIDKQTGELGAIDFTELSSYKTTDPNSSRTLDAISR